MSITPTPQAKAAAEKWYFTPEQIESGLRQDLAELIQSAIDQATADKDKLIEELTKERDEARAQVEQWKTRPPAQHDQGMFMPCGHNSYWRTLYNTCMACDRVAAEKARDELGKLVEILQEYSQLLGEELFDLGAFASMHGWSSSPDRIAKGVELREKRDAALAASKPTP